MKKKVDFLIVGQGLAGTFLAFQLLKRKKSFYMIDKGHTYSSSYVAAGVINPLVLKRLTKTWRAEEFLNYNTSFYNELENFLGKKYVFNLPVKKLISSSDDEAFWKHRFKKADLKDFIYKDLKQVNASLLASKEFLVGEVKQTSWVNISDLLEDFRASLLKSNLLKEDLFNHNELSDKCYSDIAFNHLIFCEGANALKNPLFRHLPFSLNKGQLITIKSTDLPKGQIFKKKVFVLPISQNEFKIGATYSWKWDDSSEESAHKVEKEKTDQLKKSLEEITTSSYSIVKEETGIRPAVKDRRPLMGQHKEIDTLLIFNGMGSRGCFMAPLLSNELVEFIIEGKTIHPEANVNRFY